MEQLHACSWCCCAPSAAGTAPAPAPIRSSSWHELHHALDAPATPLSVRGGSDQRGTGVGWGGNRFWGGYLGDGAGRTHGLLTQRPPSGARNPIHPPLAPPSAREAHARYRVICCDNACASHRTPAEVWGARSKSGLCGGGARHTSTPTPRGTPARPPPPPPGPGPARRRPLARGARGSSAALQRPVRAVPPARGGPPCNRAAASDGAGGPPDPQQQRRAGRLPPPPAGRRPSRAAAPGGRARRRRVGHAASEHRHVTPTPQSTALVHGASTGAVQSLPPARSVTGGAPWPPASRPRPCSRPPAAPAPASSAAGPWWASSTPRPSSRRRPSGSA